MKDDEKLKLFEEMAEDGLDYDKAREIYSADFAFEYMNWVIKEGKDNG